MQLTDCLQLHTALIESKYKVRKFRLVQVKKKRPRSWSFLRIPNYAFATRQHFSNSNLGCIWTQRLNIQVPRSETMTHSKSIIVCVNASPVWHTGLFNLSSYLKGCNVSSNRIPHGYLKSLTSSLVMLLTPGISVFWCKTHKSRYSEGFVCLRVAHCW